MGGPNLRNDYEIRGDITAIFLKRKDGSVIETIISTSDLEKIRSLSTRWSAFAKKGSPNFYVCGHTYVNKKRIKHALHRFILDEPDGLLVDHINRDTLDNTRSNLRAVTVKQNGQNRGKYSTRSNTGLRGVYWRERNKIYVAQVKVNQKIIYLGSFKNIADAEKAVIEGRKKYMPYSVEV